MPGISLTVGANIAGGLWEKWAFTAATGILCWLFRGPVGPILATAAFAPVGGDARMDPWRPNPWN